MTSIGVSLQTIQRVAVISCVVVVNVFNEKTSTYFSSIAGLCAACLVFIITLQLETKSVRPRLLRRICLLYCNQTVRKLFVAHDNSPNAVFSNVLLAVTMAVVLMVVCDDGSKANVEMIKMLDSLLYLYGDILTFMFQYGVFKVTVFALGASFFLNSIEPPRERISLFIWDLAKIISTTLISQGINAMIVSTPQLEFIECIATSVVLQKLLPSMQGYIIYIGAQRLLFLTPDMSCIFFCAIVFTDFMPQESRQWIGELCAIYIVTDITTRVAEINVWGVLIILILAHYIEHILTVRK
jgi:hypothetical protein